MNLEMCEHSSFFLIIVEIVFEIKLKNILNCII